MIRLLSFIFCFFSLSMVAQEATFFLEVKTQEVLLGHPVKVSFVLENGQGSNFSPPDWQGLEVVSGPAISTNMQIINGATTRSTRYTYYLRPPDIGTYYLLPATIEVNNRILETIPQEIVVVPNPDGIPPTEVEENPFRSFGFDDLFRMEQPNVPPAERQPKPATPKPKRKRYRI